MTGIAFPLPLNLSARAATGLDFRPVSSWATFIFRPEEDGQRRFYALYATEFSPRQRSLADNKRPLVDDVKRQEPIVVQTFVPQQSIETFAKACRPASPAGLKPSVHPPARANASFHQHKAQPQLSCGTALQIKSAIPRCIAQILVSTKALPTHRAFVFVTADRVDFAANIRPGNVYGKGSVPKRPESRTSSAGLIPAARTRIRICSA